MSSPVLEDLDQDGDIEVAIGIEGQVLVWDLAGTYNEVNIEWKMFRHDLWHTGFYSSSLPNLPPFVRDVEASPGYVAPGSSVTITAKVSDEDGVSSVTAEIESPDETVHGTITLYDDGAHNDGAAGDGTYGNTWTTLSTRLDYVVDVTAIDSLSNSYTHDNVAGFTTQDVAYVQYNTHTINSDDINYDGTANPGEYVQFSITLENIGVLSAPSVTATISTMDSCISYYDTGVANFGDIASGGTATCGSYDYYFRVSNTCPHSHTVTFDLDIGDSNGNTWTDHFDVTIIDNIGPVLYSANVTPRNATAGEPVAITAYVEDGSGVSSVQAVIESPDETPVITVTLHDDGAHDDGGASDGTFGNTWTTDVTQRNYYVDFVTQDGLANVRAYDNLTVFTTKAFSKTADVLLVADYYTYDTDWFRHYYTDALDTIGYSYDVWDSHWRGEIDAATLNQYVDGAVIWSTPYWGYMIYSTAQTNLKSYLDAGGSLFVSSQDAGYYLNAWGNTDFLNGYLHANFIQDDTDLLALNGVPGDPIGDGLSISISGGDGANNQYDTDEIAPISPAVTVFTYDPSGTGGLRVDTGDYKVVYFSFGFEGINSADDRATVMGRVLAWLQGVLPPVASFTSSSPDWLGQETVFTNTTVVTGPVSYLWTFGDGVTSTLESPAHTYGSPGVYTVVLTATNVLGSDVATDTATIHKLPTVRIAPASGYVKTESTSTFTVTVEDAQNLGGFDFDLTFDPTLLQVDDVTLGDFLGSTGRSTGELGPDINNDTGLVTFGAFSFGSQDGPNGAGTLAVLTFTTFITPGVSALDLQDVLLSDTEAQTQSVQAAGGSVTILDGPRIGSPAFASSVPSDELLTVTARITNTASGTGIASATLRYGYTVPYTQSSVPGSGPGGAGNGEWTFTVPPQGDSYEGQTLRFSLVAQDGDAPPGETVDDNDGIYYGVIITDDDTAPPVFSNPAPATVVSVYSITLQVDIADAESGVADNDAPAESVYVEWDTDGEFAIDAYQADMDWVSGTAYAIDPPIAPLSAGITVTWRVYAEDDDNYPTGGWSTAYETGIISALFGDLDHDCDVDIDDIMIVAAHWNSETGDPDYDSRYDFDGDGDIDVLDVMKVAAEWGNTCGRMAAVRLVSVTRLSQEGAEVRFDPPTAVAQVGVPLTMDIAIAQVTDLGGFEFDLLFDSNVITVTDVRPSNFLASSGNNAATLGPRYEGSGRLVFGGFSYGEHEGAGGYGTLATLELILLENTEAVLSLEDVQLTTSGAEQVSLHSVGEGRVRTEAHIYLPLILRNS